jgi:hypothetical protein
MADVWRQEWDKNKVIKADQNHNSTVWLFGSGALSPDHGKAYTTADVAGGRLVEDNRKRVLLVKLQAEIDNQVGVDAEPFQGLAMSPSPQPEKLMVH